MKSKKIVFAIMMLLTVIILIVSGCSSSDSPTAPNTDNNGGIEKTVDTSVVIQPDYNRGITLAVFDADKNSIAHMTIRYCWEGADVMDADTVWEPPVVAAYQIEHGSNGYKHVTAVKKKDSDTSKVYWEVKFDVDASKFSDSNPVYLDAEVAFYVFNIDLNVRVDELITYTAITKK